jgi:hypothetical protein
MDLDRVVVAPNPAVSLQNEFISRPISLEFAPETPPQVRTRLSYSFRVFAAIYSHPVNDSPTENSIRCFYGRSPSSDANSFHIPALYRNTIPGHEKRAGCSRVKYAGEDFYLSFGIDAAAGNPDWLGEIFQWLSSNYEAGIAARDDIGRIPYSATVFDREGISPHIPRANLLMAWLENAIRNGGAAEALPRAPSPVPGIDHLVVSSHDIDFSFTGRTSAAKRLIKNMGLAIQLYRSVAYFAENFGMLLELLAGKRVGDYIPRVLDAEEKLDFRSTLFVVARNGHRRDPNYRLEHLLPQIREASRRGFSIGLHGSYRSIIEARNLADEALLLQEALGNVPCANRQHWLRFDEHNNLFAQLKLSKLKCDATLGFPDRIGFRNGASFAFPPYDFVTEKAHDFLELPLALMDGSLAATSRTLRQHPQLLADEVLTNSRKYGWGGISVLWHNPIEPLSVPTAINRVFWNCASKQKEHNEKWMSVEQFLAACLPRYQRAGLLESVSIDS